MEILDSGGLTPGSRDWPRAKNVIKKYLNCSNALPSAPNTFILHQDHQLWLRRLRKCENLIWQLFFIEFHQIYYGGSDRKSQTGVTVSEIPENSDEMSRFSKDFFIKNYQIGSKLSGHGLHNFYIDCEPSETIWHAYIGIIEQFWSKKMKKCL